ncbi:MAG: hydroxymethylbilane synthase [Methylophilaceae bacterium]|nr:hydroxymethylbilane synthase [Methylophilaceae bacterium]
MLKSPSMNTLPTQLTIASRESELAMWQARYIRTALQHHYPHISIQILGMSTSGDQLLEHSLAKIGGKGLFVKELEIALRTGQADLAVHSLKDLPMRLADDFAWVATSAREDAHDALVSHHFASLDALPIGARVGTSSLRRQSLLQAYYPHVHVLPLRGNLQTRLAKLDDGQYDAIVLAAAGLMRLGLAERIRARLPLDKFIPAPGQGALGIEICARRADVQALLQMINNPHTASCVLAERAMSRALGGNCSVPLGAYAHLHGQILQVSGFVASVDGSALLKAKVEGAPADAERLGTQLAQILIARGANQILAAFAP